MVMFLSVLWLRAISRVMVPLQMGMVVGECVRRKEDGKRNGWMKCSWMVV